MASPKLKNIKLLINPLSEEEIKLLIDDGSINNYKTWTIEKIIKEIWFFVNEEYRIKVHDIILNRKGGQTLFKKYMDKYVENNCIVKHDEMNMYFKNEFMEFDDSTLKNLNNCKINDNSEKDKYSYIVTKEYRCKLRTIYTFIKSKRFLNPLKYGNFEYHIAIYEISSVICNEHELKLVLKILKFYNYELSKINLFPKGDTNASKKNIIGQKTYISSIKKEMKRHLLNNNIGIKHTELIITTIFKIILNK